MQPTYRWPAISEVTNLLYIDWTGTRQSSRILTSDITFSGARDPQRLDGGYMDLKFGPRTNNNYDSLRMFLFPSNNNVKKSQTSKMLEKNLKTTKIYMCEKKIK